MCLVSYYFLLKSYNNIIRHNSFNCKHTNTYTCERAYNEHEFSKCNVFTAWIVSSSPIYKRFLNIYVPPNNLIGNSIKYILAFSRLFITKCNSNNETL